jgi:aminoglycoside phosphotransferase (APT) family kinase protein
MIIRTPAPRVFGEAAAARPDARTAEVLRALHRAKGTIAEPDAPTSARSMETLGWELRSPREWLSKTSPIVEEAARRLATNAAVFERSILVPSEKLDAFQRSHDSAVRELREAVQALKRQADALAAWRAWWARHVAALCFTIALLLAGGIGFAWKAHTLAKSTHDILAQILANQESAQTAKAGKRR